MKEDKNVIEKLLKIFEMLRKNRCFRKFTK